MTPAQAGRRISAILAELERETGQIVKEIEITTIDVSTLAAQRVVRGVSIRLEPIPGAAWDLPLEDDR